MSFSEKTCVSCGKVFALLPSKPGFANMCPQCSASPAEAEVIGREPRQKRRQTTNELVADAERRLRRLRKMNDLIFGRGGK